MRIIAGPCQHESLEQSLEIAKECKRVCDKFEIEYYFKASYDKANRTKGNSPRGFGVIDTRRDFNKLKYEIQDLKILTDVHSISDILYLNEHCIKSIKSKTDFSYFERLVEPDNSYVDVLQIPAFLSRQTDLIEAAARTGKIVNIKKGQFMTPWDIHSAVEKAQGAKEVWVTDRGTSFGYSNLVVDFMGMDYLQFYYKHNFVFDATHAVQKCPPQLLDLGVPCAPRDYAPGLLRAAAAMGVRSFFMEVHKDPDNALSDGPNSLYLNDFEMMVEELVRINDVV
jgi:2-dehydro-3-deoxyphosphooctonate aldolase (KDO 8-P synthase)